MSTPKLQRAFRAVLARVPGAQAVALEALPRGFAFSRLAKAPVLKRPILFIPGLTMPGEPSYRQMTRHFAKTNGPIALFDAKTRTFTVELSKTDKRPATPAELAKLGCKLFVLNYTDPTASITQKQPDLRAFYDAVDLATGEADSIDVVTHSAGCSEFQQFLHDAKPDQLAQRLSVNNFFRVGDVAEGTVMGTLGEKIGKPFGGFEAAAQLAERSPEIRALQRSWLKDRDEKIQGRVVDLRISGGPTYQNHQIHLGDGFGIANELRPGVDDLKIIRTPNFTPTAHLWEIVYSRVTGHIQEQLRAADAAPL